MVKYFRFLCKIEYEILYLCIPWQKFELHILGCGSALPTTRHFATSQVVNLREKLFMIDCGEGAQMQLRRSRLKFSRLNHIFISHLHGDHCSDYPGDLLLHSDYWGGLPIWHIHLHWGLEVIVCTDACFLLQDSDLQSIFSRIRNEGADAHLR